MCRSLKDGGQRCAAHARSRFKKLDRSDPEWDEAAVEYAATSEGALVIDELWQQAARVDDEDAKAHLSSVKRRGRERAQSHAAVRAAIAQAKGGAAPAEPECKGPLSERLLDFKADFEPLSTAEKILPGHLNVSKVMRRAGQQPTPPAPNRFLDSTPGSNSAGTADPDSFEYEELNVAAGRARHQQALAAEFDAYGSGNYDEMPGPAVLTRESD